MLSAEQMENLKAAMLEQLHADTPDAVHRYLDKHLDRGADFGADAQGLGTEVTAQDSSLNSFSVLLPASTTVTLNADLFFWGDLVPYGPSAEASTYTGAKIGPDFNAPLNTLGSVSGAVSTTTAAQFATSGFGWQPPTWLNGALGTNGNSGIQQGQTYQLSLLYLFQNVAQFSNLNINSSESATQAPVLQSVNLTLKQTNPYGAQTNNGTPLSNALKAEQYRQNQVIIDLSVTMSLFDWINMTTATPAGTSPAVTFLMQFQSRYKKAVAKAFHATVTSAKKTKALKA